VGGTSVTHRFLWLAVFGFLLNGNWEWLQTPLYDDAAKPAIEVLRFRLHCTAGDVLILLVCALGVSGVRRSTSWLSRPHPSDLALLAILGVGYTFVSELVNVGRGSWAYSELMPLVPGTSVGVVPLAQWLLLPMLAAWMSARIRRSGG
jgi:hypothetical protein